MKSIVVSEGNESFISVDHVLYSSDLEMIWVPEAVEGKIRMPDGLTAIVDQAFAQRRGLTSAVIPDTVTSIGSNVFYGCVKLESITIGSNLPVIGDHTFYGCTSLTSVSIPSSVSSIGDWSFYGCNGLSSVTIESSVGSIGEYAFSRCENLESIALPETLEMIGNRAFYGCVKLNSILIEEGNTSFVMDGGILYDFDKTELLFATKGVEGDVRIPRGVASIEQNAFERCIGITTVYIPETVTSIDSYEFNGCDSLRSIEVHPDNGAYSSHDGVLYNKSGTVLMSIPSGIESVFVLDSVTSIMFDFYTCPVLKSIEVGRNNASFSSRDGVMYDKSGTKLIRVPMGLERVSIPPGVTDIEYAAFSGCKALSSIVLPSSVTRISDSAFYGCTGLKSFTLPPNVELIGSHVFSECTGLESFTIPAGIDWFGSFFFEGCTGLKSVIVSEGVTSIGECMFYNCTGLTTIVLPGSVSYIGNEFETVGSLKDVHVNGDDSFNALYPQLNDRLEVLRIGSDVTRIDPSIGVNCPNLKHFTVDTGNRTYYSTLFGVYSRSDDTPIWELGTYHFRVEQIGELVYDGTEQQPEFAIVDPGIEGVVLTVSDAVRGVSAGDYSADASFFDISGFDGDWAIILDDGGVPWSIGKKPVSAVQADAIEYDSESHAPVFDIAGAIGTDDVSVAFDSNGRISAGEYDSTGDISLVGGDASNYRIEGRAIWHIDRKQIAAVQDGVCIITGADSAPVFETTGVIDGDHVSVRYTKPHATGVVHAPASDFELIGADASNYAISDPVRITIVKPVLNLTSATIVLDASGVGGSALSVYGVPEGLAIEWDSNDESVATVDSGIVAAVAPGNATITLSIDGIDAATCLVTVVEGERTVVEADGRTTITETFDGGSRETVIEEGRETVTESSGGITTSTTIVTSGDVMEKEVSIVDLANDVESNIRGIGGMEPESSVQVSIGVDVTDDQRQSVIDALDKIEEVATGSKPRVDIVATDEDIRAATIHGSMASAVSDRDGSISVRTSAGEVSLDSDVLNTIATECDSVSLALDAVDHSVLTSSQRDRVGSDDVVYRVLLSSEDRLIGELGGTATITIPYVLKPGQSSDNIQVWYISSHGYMERFDCEYDPISEAVTFETTHFSDYAIRYVAGADSDDGSRSHSIIIAIGGGLAGLAVIGTIAGRIIRRRS